MEGFPSQSTLIKFLDFLRELMSADGVLLHLCGKSEQHVYRGNSSKLSKERQASFFHIIELALERQGPVVLTPHENNGFSHLDNSEFARIIYKKIFYNN